MNRCNGVLKILQNKLAGNLIGFLLIMFLIFNTGAVFADSLDLSNQSVSADTIKDTDSLETVLSTEKAESKQVQSLPTLMDFLTSGKYIGFIILIIIGIALLLSRRIKLWIRIVIMLAAFVLYGFDYFFPSSSKPNVRSNQAFHVQIYAWPVFPGVPRHVSSHIYTKPDWKKAVLRLGLPPRRASGPG